MSGARPILAAFTKIFPGVEVDQLIAAAHDCGIEGFDVCLRGGFPINPQNVGAKLPDACRRIRAAGLDVPMISGEGGLLSPDDPTAVPILAAMDEAGVRLLKLGYYRFDPLTQNYWDEVGKARKAMAGWENLARRYHVKVCYHTHAGLMFCNCATLMHLLKDFDPQWIGAYIDPGHMRIEGEPFPLGTAIVSDCLCAVGLKDVALAREPKDGHGHAVASFGVSAGEGMVDWTEVFGVLGRLGFAGPLSVHCVVMAYAKVPPDRHAEYIRREFEFFRRLRDGMGAKQEQRT